MSTSRINVSLSSVSIVTLEPEDYEEKIKQLLRVCDLLCRESDVEDRALEPVLGYRHHLMTTNAYRKSPYSERGYLCVEALLDI